MQETSFPTHSEGLPAPIATAAEDLAEQLEVNSAFVTVESWTKVTWCDSCLGITFKETACLQAITPGYVIRLSAEGEQYTSHIRRDGKGLIVELLRHDEDFVHEHAR